VLFIDEPTSGLDARAAARLVDLLRCLARDSNGALGVVVSLQQPNIHVLECFSHILLLGRGSMVFFGTLGQARAHFSYLGFPPPYGQAPTDHYLLLTDPTFATGRSRMVDFNAIFHDSVFAKQLDACLRRAQKSDAEELAPSPIFVVGPCAA
jgi:ABC-type multidrug transport system ATPase subunit